MLAAIQQDVQCCDRKMFSLPLAMDQQAVQHYCGSESLSPESCQRALVSSWRHVRGRLPV